MGSSNKWQVIALLSLFACGEDESFDCERDDWKGYYRLTSTTLDGNCGSVETRNVYIDEGIQTLDPGCIETYEQWSKDECHLDRNLECVVMTDAGSMTYTWQGSIDQDAESGKMLQARVRLAVISNSTGNTLCSGSYSFLYVKL